MEDTKLHPRARQAGHLCRCSQRDQDAAGSTAGLVTMTSIAGIHKLRRVHSGLSPLIFQQMNAWQPEAEDLSQQASDSPVQSCLHLVQAARGLLPRHLALTSQLRHPLCHMEPRGCPPRSTPRVNASEALPHCCLHSDAGNTLPSALLGRGAGPQPPGTGKWQAFA